MGKLTIPTPLPLSEGSKYALVYMDTAPGLIQAFPCHCANQAIPSRELKKASTMYRYLHQMVLGDHLSKVMPCKTGQKNMTLEGSFPQHPQEITLVERESGIVNSQIKLLTGKATLAGWT